LCGVTTTPTWLFAAATAPRGHEDTMTTLLASLNNPLFWDKKVRIAILTIATFIALC
jgi:hypothetical protein